MKLKVTARIVSYSDIRKKEFDQILKAIFEDKKIQTFTSYDDKKAAGRRYTAYIRFLDTDLAREQFKEIKKEVDQALDLDNDTACIWTGNNMMPGGGIQIRFHY